MRIIASGGDPLGRYIPLLEYPSRFILSDWLLDSSYIAISDKDTVVFEDVSVKFGGGSRDPESQKGSRAVEPYLGAASFRGILALGVTRDSSSRT